MKPWKSEKWLDSGYVLKEDPTGFSDGLDVAFERQRQVEDGSLIFGLNNSRMEFPFTKIMEPGGGRVVRSGDREFTLEYVKLEMFLVVAILSK